jgi:hypothetical protein
VAPDIRELRKRGTKKGINNHMTLVITEVSEKFGCVVVGDSAVTLNKNRIVFGAEKIHYSDQATVGFAIWGNACLAGRRIDELVAAFVEGLPNTASPRSAGRDLAAFLVDEGKKDGRPWNALRGGVHVCGYQDTVPVLFHIHTGPDLPQNQGPFELHEDYPNASDGAHLRNGYYRVFAALFSGMEEYAAGLSQLGFKWPYEAVEDRVSYYSIMVETVARTLESAGRLPAVGGVVSALAFNRNGLQVDKRLQRRGEFCRGDNASAAF